LVAIATGRKPTDDDLRRTAHDVFGSFSEIKDASNEPETLRLSQDHVVNQKLIEVGLEMARDPIVLEAAYRRFANVINENAIGFGSISPPGGLVISPCRTPSPIPMPSRALSTSPPPSPDHFSASGRPARRFYSSPALDVQDKAAEVEAKYADHDGIPEVNDEDVFEHVDEPQGVRPGQAASAAGFFSRVKQWLMSLLGWSPTAMAVSARGVSAAAAAVASPIVAAPPGGLQSAVVTEPVWKNLLYLGIGVGSLLITLALIRRLDLSNTVFPPLLSAIISRPLLTSKHLM